MAPHLIGHDQPGPDPVFVLCAARSGSTLLRFVLDAHPDLACPPETNVPDLCAQLATVWSLIEGAPLSADREGEPPEIPDAAVAGVRETMDRMTGSYLARRGKKRYCDKSLGTARYADLLTRVWPGTRFICVYRQPMDVIASGIEACPWGLNGYGFEPYSAATPGNSVLALARFWIDNAERIAATEERYPDRCHRVRYEDLVADPQAVADGIFEFLQAAPVPDVTDRMFAEDRERFGPADFKIWSTSGVSEDSVGRGWDLPVGMISPPELERMNVMASRLGYTEVDDGWGTSGRPSDLRADVGDRTDRARCAAGADTADAAALVRSALAGGLARARAEFAGRWRPYGGDAFGIVVTGDGLDTGWVVDLTARTIVPDDDGEDDGDRSTWDMIGTASTWRQVLDGTLNFSLAMRRNLLRYCDADAAGPVGAAQRTAMLTDLLGLVSWKHASARPTTTSAGIPA